MPAKGRATTTSTRFTLPAVTVEVADTEPLALPGKVKRGKGAPTLRGRRDDGPDTTADRIVLFTVLERHARRPDVDHPVEWFEDVPRDWTIPARPRPASGLKFLKSRRLYGAAQAVTMLLEDLLDPGGYDAFLNADPDEDAIAAVTEIATRVLLGREGN